MHFSQGHCPRGYMCGFSHSQAELVTARERDPTYKTKICSTWKESGGECSKGAMCIFAHGVGDLRTKVGVNTYALSNSYPFVVILNSSRYIVG